MVQKSDRSYEDPAPNTQQQPPARAHAPATPDYKESQPSTPRQGSPSPEMLNTAANTASTLPCCVCSPVMSLSLPADLPTGLQMEKRDSSKLSSSAPFDGGRKLPAYLFSFPHQQCPAPPAASSGSAATQTLGT